MNPADTSNGITAITVRGFKSIYDELRMELRPLTILAGANSSGKSSFIQPLLLMKQTLESPYDPGVFRLNGPNVRFTSSEQILSKIQGLSEVDMFSIGFEQTSCRQLKMTYKKVEGKGFEIFEMLSGNEKDGKRLSLGMTHDDIAQNYVDQNQRAVMGQYGEMDGWHYQAIRTHCFLKLAIVRNKDQKARWVDFSMTDRTDPLQKMIEGIVHVPGLRGNPERNYNRTSVGPTFPGTFESYVASVISQWQTDSSDKVEALGKELERLGLTWKVEAKPLDDTLVELRIGRLPRSQRGGAYDTVSIADVGIGVSQTLPVLVALLAAEPGQIVYIEQPELHLHPLAQRRMAHVLANAAKRGVRVIVETHSSLLLRGIQTLVAGGKLDKNLVKLHWFKRKENGATGMTSADLDENGAFGEDWPEDFDQTHLNSEKAYLDAVEKRMAQP